MKYFLFTLLIVGGFSIASVANATTFQFVNGEPAVSDDGVVGDTFEQTKYFFVNGEPHQVFDSTATETGGGGGTVLVDDIFWFN